MNEKVEHPEWFEGYQQEYMTHLHPDAFKDHVKKVKPAWAEQECLKCHGYGGWNLKLNQYMVNEPPLCHFRAHCSNCNGWGYTKREDHIHYWNAGVTIGNCLTRYTCKICGKLDVVDSSD